MSTETQTQHTDTAASPRWQAPDLIPAVRYRDAAAAIDWLQRAFGFERHAVYQGEDGTIHHAELRAGSGMLMLGSEPSAESDEHGLVGTPASVGGLTASFYVIVDDPDAHHDRAKAAGAEIVAEPTDQEYGSRDYRARDLEGQLWSFGTYRPSA